MLTKLMRRSYAEFRPNLSVSLTWCAGYILTHLGAHENKMLMPGAE